MQHPTHLVVLVKPVLEIARLRPDQIPDSRLPLDGATWALNPFDEYALENALRLRETLVEIGERPEDCRLSVIAAGPPQAADVLKKTIAVGADDVTFIADPLFFGADGAVVATALAQAIRARAPYAPVILCGQQSLDAAQGVVGPMTAQLLNFSGLGRCRRVAWASVNALRLLREEGDALDDYEVDLPALIACVKGDHELRTANIKGVMRANKTPIHTLSPAELGLSPEALAPRAPAPMLQPRPHKAPAVTLNAQDMAPEAAAGQIVEFLKTRKIL